jgi:hypothetical protein
MFFLVVSFVSSSIRLNSHFRLPGIVSYGSCVGVSEDGQTIVSELAKAVRVKGLVDCCLRKWARTATHRLLLLAASWIVYTVNLQSTTTMATESKSNTEHDEILSDDERFLEDGEEGVMMEMMALVVTDEVPVEVGYTTVTLAFVTVSEH